MKTCRARCPLAGATYVVCRRGMHSGARHEAAFACYLGAKSDDYASVYIEWYDPKRPLVQRPPAKRHKVG